MPCLACGQPYYGPTRWHADDGHPLPETRSRHNTGSRWMRFAVCPYVQLAPSLLELFELLEELEQQEQEQAQEQAEPDSDDA